MNTSVCSIERRAGDVGVQRPAGERRRYTRGRAAVADAVFPQAAARHFPCRRSGAVPAPGSRRIAFIPDERARGGTDPPAFIPRNGLPVHGCRSRSPEIFDRAAREGRRRLDQSLLELVSTSFIAGFTILSGIVALGIAHAAVAPHSEGRPKLAGALAFAIGLVFLAAGRPALFTANFFDPVATAFQGREPGILAPLLRPWGITFVLDLAGGAGFALLVSVQGVLPQGAGHSLRKVAEGIAHRGALAVFVSAVVGGGLVALLSFLLQAANSVGSRIALAYLVGFLLAAGPFDHVIVTVLHVSVGMLFGAPVGVGALPAILAIATAGNLAGGIGLVTLSHVAQAEGAKES